MLLDDLPYEDLEEYYDQIEEETLSKEKKRQKKPKMIVDGASVKLLAELTNRRYRRQAGEYQ